MQQTIPVNRNLHQDLSLGKSVHPLINKDIHQDLGTGKSVQPPVDKNIFQDLSLGFPSLRGWKLLLMAAASAGAHLRKQGTHPGRSLLHFRAVAFDLSTLLVNFLQPILRVLCLRPLPALLFQTSLPLLRRGKLGTMPSPRRSEHVEQRTRGGCSSGRRS